MDASKVTLTFLQSLRTKGHGASWDKARAHTALRNQIKIVAVSQIRHCDDEV